jgi:DNA-binding MarR family transcriptional regulator
MTHTQGADTERGANLLGTLSLAVADRVADATAAAAGQGGSAPAALSALHEYLGGEPIDSLSRALGVTHSAAVRLVDRLADTGLVERRPGPDGRSVAVVPTDAGRDAARRVTEARAAALEEVLAVLSEAERRQLARLHEKLLAGVTPSRAAARHLCRLCDPVACGHHEGRCPVTRAADAAAA